MLFSIFCPITAFPPPSDREYRSTYRYAPKPTVIGLLLSLIGEESYPDISIKVGSIGTKKPVAAGNVGRNFHTEKTPKEGKRKYLRQQILTNVAIAVEIPEGEFLDRVKTAINDPSSISRYGLISLGESCWMIDGIREYRESDGQIYWLEPDPKGAIALPTTSYNISPISYERYKVHE